MKCKPLKQYIIVICITITYFPNLANTCNVNIRYNPQLESGSWNLLVWPDIIAAAAVVCWYTCLAAQTCPQTTAAAAIAICSPGTLSDPG